MQIKMKMSKAKMLREKTKRVLLGKHPWCCLDTEACRARLMHPKWRWGPPQTCGEKTLRCGASPGGGPLKWWCTKEAGHPGDHVACNPGEHNLHIWHNDAYNYDE